MAYEFANDVVVITGAANGLGREYALLLARLGARVVVNDIGGTSDGVGSDESAAAATVREITEAGGTAIAQTSDGSTVEGAQAMIGAALDEYGRVDAVICNAGIVRDKSFHKISEEDFWKVVDVHLKGTVRTFAAAYPLMREQGYGRLVSTTSASGLWGIFGQTNYAAAKMGIVGFTRVVAIEGAKSGINANVIAPMARTRLSKAELPDGVAEMIHPRKVAPLGAYLVHPSTTVTGEVFCAGGGRFARVRVGAGVGVWTEEPTVEFVADSIEHVLAEEMRFPAAAVDDFGLFQQAQALHQPQRA